VTVKKGGGGEASHKKKKTIGQNLEFCPSYLRNMMGSRLRGGEKKKSFPLTARTLHLMPPDAEEKWKKARGTLGQNGRKGYTLSMARSKWKRIQ